MKSLEVLELKDLGEVREVLEGVLGEVEYSAIVVVEALGDFL